jgi:hypothetical protein
VCRPAWSVFLEKEGWAENKKTATAHALNRGCQIVFTLEPSEQSTSFSPGCAKQTEKRHKMKEQSNHVNVIKLKACLFLPAKPIDVPSTFFSEFGGKRATVNPSDIDPETSVRCFVNRCSSSRCPMVVITA